MGLKNKTKETIGWVAVGIALLLLVMIALNKFGILK